MDSDGSISITSTVENDADSDAEWQVKQILAEGLVAGQTRYLIEWEGFSLSAASWEPKEHLHEDLLEEWNLTKQKQQDGTALWFHIDQWRKAKIEHNRAKYARHDMRNRKRRLLGLKTTAFDITMEEVTAKINSVEQTNVGPVANSNLETLAQPYSIIDNNSEKSATPEEPIQAHSSVDELFSDHNSEDSAALEEPTQARSSVDDLCSDHDSDNIYIQNELIPEHSPLHDLFSDNDSDDGDAQKELIPEQSPLHDLFSDHDSDNRAIQEGPLPEQTSVDNRISSHSPENNIDLSPRSLEPARQRSFSPTPKAYQESTDLASIQKTNQLPQQLHQVFAGISIESAECNISASARENVPAVSAMEEVHGAGNGPESDTMDIDDMIGNASPATTSFPNSPNILQHTSPGNLRGGLKHRKIQPQSAPMAIMETETSQRERAEPQKSKPAITRKPTSKPLSPLLVKKKRVSFSFATIERRSDSDESSLFVANDSHVLQSATSDPNTSSLNKATVGSSEATGLQESDGVDESLTKICVVGSMKLSCSFYVRFRPARSETTWYDELMKLETFNFSHMCTAQDFIQQLQGGELSSGFWVGGTACSHLPTNESEVLLDYLKSSSLGLLCHSDGLCLLVYPSNCVDWQQSPLPTAAPAAGHSLRYLTFLPGTNFRLDDLSLEFSQTYPSSVGIFDKQLYQKLLLVAKDRSRPLPDSFFLLFPPSAKPEEDLLCRWLRVFNRNCEIRSGALPGHWSQFVEGTRGTVIIHPDCVGSLHRVPHLAKLLHRRHEDYGFWIFRLPFRAPIFHPGPMDEYLDQLGIAFDWVFPPGVALMATPSFFVSQPLQAYVLLKWIWQNFSDESEHLFQGRLVVCHDMAEWLFALALEKHETVSSVRESNTTLVVRMKTATLMRNLIDQMSEDVSHPVSCAPSYIDGNDEQSLVNWFAWWSLSHIDKFRKFSVICSENGDDRRLTRHINRPALRGLLAEANGTWKTKSEAGRGGFELVASDAANDLTRHIRRISDEANSADWQPLVVCPRPLHQTGRFQCGKLVQWVSFFADNYMARAVNGGDRFSAKKNTQLGFFYTTCDAEPGGYPRDESIRSPWIAVVRPMELHRKPWTHMELLIWDHRLRDLTRNSECIAESDLSPAQQELIAEVSRQYDYIKLPLNTVWAGGFKASKLHTHPLDITLDWMSAVVDNIKSWLPLKQDDMLRRGWTQVHKRNSSRTSSSPILTRSAAVPDAVEAPEPAAEEMRRCVVFEPPTDGRDEAKPCPNLLREWAMAARVESESEYTYVPTMKWYRGQHEAGRGFEHIQMWSWKQFFEHYKIPDPEQ